MTNAEKFQKIFKKFATEVWAFPEKDFLTWLNAEYSEPIKGQWLPQNDDYCDWYECSECGYGSEGEMQYSSEYDVRTNFCPNCGADMREGDE